jgi:hydroxymethylpyrimidine pyrophosphatase-like HAD family hydrolase
LESYKIFIYGYFSSTLDKITKKMEKEFSDLEIIKHGKYSLEITNKNVTK